jgi:hypothetical protein
MRQPQLFLLRLWGDGPFRVALRSLDDQEPVLFTAPAQLTEFLVARCRCNDEHPPGEKHERSME